MPTTSWRRLESRVKTLFRECGCSAKKTIVQGPGSVEYEIDCLVTFEALGMPVKWIVECKDWASRVPQEVAAALRQRVTDTGADKGILVCPSGFQSGAINQAEISSLILVTPSQLEEKLFDEARRLILNEVFSQIRELRDQIVGWRLQLEDYLYSYENVRNIDGEYACYNRLFRLFAALAATELHLQEWEAGRPSLGPPADLECSQGKTDFVNDRQMLKYVSSLILEIKRRVGEEAAVLSIL